MACDKLARRARARIYAASGLSASAQPAAGVDGLTMKRPATNLCHSHANKHVSGHKRHLLRAVPHQVQIRSPLSTTRSGCIQWCNLVRGSINPFEANRMIIKYFYRSDGRNGEPPLRHLSATLLRLTQPGSLDPPFLRRVATIQHLFGPTVRHVFVPCYSQRRMSLVDSFLSGVAGDPHPMTVA